MDQRFGIEVGVVPCRRNKEPLGYGGLQIGTESLIEKPLAIDDNVIRIAGYLPRAVIDV